jgi:rubrerythrin
MVIVTEAAWTSGRGESDEPVLLAMNCSYCGYGVSVRKTPPSCPMCGEHSWQLDTSRTPASAA